MKTRFAAALALTLSATPLRAADTPAPASAPVAKAALGAPADDFKNDDQRALYSYGFQIGRRVAEFGLNDSEIKIFSRGLRDAALGKKPALDPNVYLPKMGDLVEKRSAAKAGPIKAKGKAFAAKFAKEPGVQAIPDGGWIKTTEEGKGAAATADDTVKVNYRGTLIDGTEFDSSFKRGEPATFPLKSVIPCWTHGVAMMKAGGKAKLVCPSDAAYGDHGHPPVIPGGATLVFEIELLEVVKPEPPKAETPKAEAPKTDAPKAEEKK